MHVVMYSFGGKNKYFNISDWSDTAATFRCDEPSDMPIINMHTRMYKHAHTQWRGSLHQSSILKAGSLKKDERSVRIIKKTLEEKESRKSHYACHPPLIACINGTCLKQLSA